MLINTQKRCPRSCMKKAPDIPSKYLSKSEFLMTIFNEMCLFPMQMTKRLKYRPFEHNKSSDFEKYTWKEFTYNFQYSIFILFFSNNFCMYNSCKLGVLEQTLIVFNDFYNDLLDARLDLTNLFNILSVFYSIYFKVK